MIKPRARTRHIKARLGAIPSGVDIRSFDYMKLPDSVALAATPDEYTSLLAYAPDNFKRSQGNVGTCVGWDWAYCYETQYGLMAMHETGSPWRNYVPKDMSSGWGYQLSRQHSIPPVPGPIEGSTNLGAVRAAKKAGMISEQTVPTDTIAPFNKTTITDELLAEAANYRISSYHNVPNDSEIIKATMYGLVHELPYKMPDGSPGASPLLSAFPVYANFKDSYDDGIVPMPSGRLLGGHSSPIFGWQLIDDGEYWTNFGSWGTDIGDNGIFHIPFGYPFYKNDWWLLSITSPSDPDPDNNSTCPVARAYAWAWNVSAGIVGSQARMKPITTRR